MRKTTTTDDKGRIVIPREIRDKYGNRYGVVELRDRIELVPVHDDPVEGLREVVSDAFDEKPVREIRTTAHETAVEDALDGTDDRSA